jgi:5-methylcytosine-specific restriction endonuclease McrA
MLYRVMSNMIPAIEGLSDNDLLAEVHHLTECERQATARLIAALGELDARRLYLAEGCSSLFTYCTQVLHLSEHAAYRRIEAARVARRYPLILECLANGSVTVTAIGLLASHLTTENHRTLLERARHQSKRAIEHLVAELHPKPDTPSVVRRLPVPTSMEARTEAAERTSSLPVLPTAPIASPVRAAVLTPIAPERYKVQLTVDGETYRKLRQAQALLRHVVPSGDLTTIVDRALTRLVEHLERTRLGATTASRSRPSAHRSRHIPAAVKRAVWARDEGRCRFVGSIGRCTELGGLEFHHVVPFADGGTATVENIELRCRSHNQHEAEHWFGPLLVREVQMCYSVWT